MKTLYKYTLAVRGMRCGMCEMHVEEALRKNLKIKKAKASHFKNEVVVFSLLNLSEEDFKNALDPTGYIITSFKRDVAVRKIFRWR